MLKWMRMTALVLACISVDPMNAADPQRPQNFARENLVAWCIVPFDAKHRSPAERAEMVQSLGLRRVAYDWREEHVASFEEEIQQYQQRGLEFFAFWSWHDALEPLVIKYQVRPQVWITCPSPESDSQEQRVRAAVDALRPLATKTAALGLSLGLYNHGGWGGEPANLVAVCEALRQEQNSDHIGIVYNFHHGHEHIDDFPSSLALMKPYLLCLNLNGMADAERVRNGTDKILPLGQGRHEKSMIAAVIDSGYTGPIGIIHHRSEIDAEQGLRENLDGLDQILDERGR